MQGRGVAAAAARALALVLASLVGLALAACERPKPLDYSGPLSDWPEYGRDKGGLRFSPLTQITPANVGDLRVAWTYHHGDVSDGSDGTSRMEASAVLA